MQLILIVTPPVGIEHTDVSVLMAEVCALRAEVRSMVQLSADIKEIRSALNPTIQLNAVNNVNVAVVSTSNTVCNLLNQQ